MNRFSRFFGLLIAVFCSAVALAQYDLSPGALEKVPTLEMPSQDNAALLAAEQAATRPGRPLTFAVTLPQKIRPGTHGAWHREGPLSIWRLRIVSPSAKTLNLGFSEYQLPAGAELYLLSPTEKLGPFTPADNEEHNQFWSPLLKGDELMIELRVPTPQKDLVQLYLTSVNHDFLDVTKSLSGSCNLDVICDQDDGWAIVNGYRDIIRSVGAYTLNGVNTCTGFLVNNVNQDGTPFFMTANHCGVRTGSAPSLVAYWNYENSTCRPVGSGASGGQGNGSRAVFNSGAIHLASYAPSDVTITLLDDAVNPAANAFFAGWSAEAPVPSDTVIAIHHPGVQEKRISFSFNQTYRTNNGGGTPNPAGNLLEVPDWSIGTTEGGSSGSPLFDTRKRVRGQLFGGNAACGNDEYDVYGYFHVSWTGGGTPQTRLMDWLDPCGTGSLTIDGFDSASLPTTLTAVSNCVTACNSLGISIPFQLGSGFPANTPLTITSVSPGINPTLSATSAGGGQTVNLLLAGNPAIATGTYTVVVRAGSGNNSDAITFTLNLVAGQAAAPSANVPADAATEVAPNTDLSWNAVTEALSYDVDFSEGPGFTSIVTSGRGLTALNFDLNEVLQPNTTYYWRVRSISTCGPGDWAVYSFTTSNQACGGQGASQLPISISANGTPEVIATVNVGIELPISAMEVALDIDHSFIGDLDADLVAPNGTVIRLFNAIGGGNCGGNNLSVVFTDAAVLTAADFVGTCTADPVATAGTFQPAQSFAAFADQSSLGEWRLVLRDNANFDGGNVTRFEILFCGSGGEIRDYSVNSSTTAIEACTEESTTLQFQLGSSFTSAVTVVAATELQTITQFSTAYDEATRTLSLMFADWGFLSPGTYTITFTLTAPDGTTRMVNFPLTIVRSLEAVALTSPEPDAEVQFGDVVFNWDRTAGATSYTLQYTTVEDFSTIDFAQETTNRLLTLGDLPSGQVIFWRVIANGPCGSQISEVRMLTIRPVGVQDFGGGRSVSVYPNPVRGFLTVEAKGAWTGGINALLFDVAGRQLGIYRFAGGGSQDLIDLSGLSAGVYFLRMEGAGERHTERIVVLP
ncbi:T9SS type A sorting domain-containing protein [Neolewinella lacunae]|uniref:T9SS type A sorting domain-containing protein n=1 Tax=Neolewinella lacunae TaxID=1517758 RepID=A0A923TA94_9BACT|nr:T9SS type A sorting domain-containing protein [Neolewinella lacunae]MBC6996309.1 T9SS type A sorting domain-containing protein [Neolewinella lacunae]MDN3636932.1 T9SS type A sorting domain-containing protein [Neolewinella lacunae]